MLRHACFVFAFTFLIGGPALAAGGLTLTLDAALELARARGPAAQAARMAIAEAQGQLAGARRLADNPTVAGGLGRRLGSGPEAERIEGQVELVQPLSLGGKRGARIAAAEAAVQAETAGADLALRALESEVAVAFYRLLIGQEQLKVARAAEVVTGRSAQALQRRHELRDVALLDVNVARAAHARAGALVRATEAEALGAQSELRQLLGLEPGSALQLAGDFRDQRRFSLPALLDRAGGHPRLRGLIAQAAQADAEAAAGRAERWPELGIGAAYERDEGRDVVLGLLSLELPLFDRGQGQSAAGEARARRLRFEAEAARRALVTSIRDGHVVYQRRLEAVKLLEEAVPVVEGTEELARKSFEAGQLSLAEWLVVRREAVETRLDYLDQALRAAEAGIALARRAGVSP
jgi:cobalt-zinc-cadmium efflux system outer membrane protein